MSYLYTYNAPLLLLNYYKLLYFTIPLLYLLLLIDSVTALWRYYHYYHCYRRYLYTTTVTGVIFILPPCVTIVSLSFAVVVAENVLHRTSALRSTRQTTEDADRVPSNRRPRREDYRISVFDVYLNILSTFKYRKMK